MAAKVTDEARCQHDDAGVTCGRHLEQGECSVHGRAAWPNPDACCSRNAFEDDAHSRTCPHWNDEARATLMVAWLRDEARAESPDFPDYTPAGRVLALLRSLAERGPHTGWDSVYCFYCGADEVQPHDTDCDWLLIEGALR